MNTPQPDPTAGLGGKVAGRIAETVVKATVATRQRLAPHTAGVAQQVLADFTNHVSDEIKNVMGGVWRKFADDDTTPEELRPLFVGLAQDTGQAMAWIGGAITSTGIAGGLSGVFEALLAPTVHATNATVRPGILSPSDAARAAVIGRTGGVNMETEMAFSGLSDARQQVLLALAHNPIPPDAAIELYRRGIIGRVDAEAILTRNAMEGPDIARMLALRDVPLSPADAAAAWARNALSTQDTDRVGALSGVNAHDMEILRALAGQPPSNEELLFAWRRGVITEKDVDRGIVEGPIRNEWIPVVKALQWLPLPVSEAANAVNQGHLTQAQGEAVAKENGFKPDVFKVIVDNAGIPPGPQEALDWVNQGIITEQEFRTIFLESRIKNKYIDLYLKSRRRYLTYAEVRAIYAKGGMTREQALQRLQALGFTAEDSAIILTSASADKTGHTRDLTVSQVLALRTDGLISNDQATAMLEAAGYDAQEALWVTELADLKRVSAFVTAVITRTKASYVAGRLSEVDAGAVIDQLGLPAEFKNDAFTLWDLEKTTVTKGLTTAQVTAAVKAGILTPQEGIARLTGQGYDEADAVVILKIGKAIALTG